MSFYDKYVAKPLQAALLISAASFSYIQSKDYFSYPEAQQPVVVKPAQIEIPRVTGESDLETITEYTVTHQEHDRKRNKVDFLPETILYLAHLNAVSKSITEEEMGTYITALKKKDDGQELTNLIKNDRRYKIIHCITSDFLTTNMVVNTSRELQGLDAQDYMRNRKKPNQLLFTALGTLRVMYAISQAKESLTGIAPENVHDELDDSLKELSQVYTLLKLFEEYRVDGLTHEESEEIQDKAGKVTLQVTSGKYRSTINRLKIIN